MKQALPFALAGATPLAGRLKASPEDFEVEEIPAYLPSGAGDHLYVHFEKRGLDTQQAVKRIASALGVSPREAGVAGMKDRHAITRQWASFLFGDESRLATLEDPAIRVLEVRRHGNKLKTGHLRGNRFVLRMRDAEGTTVEELARRLDALAVSGVPNYFGAQRFGQRGDNAERARAWLTSGDRGPREPFQRKLLVSALQSELFNELAAERVTRGELGTVIDGDLARKEDSGGLFLVDDLATDRERAARFEISATGPMFGVSMRTPEREAAAREARVLDGSGLTLASFESVRRVAEGTRRPYRIAVGAPTVEREADGALRIAFTLPKGAYATIVVRELLVRDAEAEAAEPSEAEPAEDS